jgi:hypothetical protein
MVAGSKNAALCRGAMVSDWSSTSTTAGSAVAACSLESDIRKSSRPIAGFEMRPRRAIQRAARAHGGVMIAAQWANAGVGHSVV